MIGIKIRAIMLSNGEVLVAVPSLASAAKEPKRFPYFPQHVSRKTRASLPDVEPFRYPQRRIATTKDREEGLP